MQKRMVKTENILSATQIKAEAARLGFSACGLAPAEPVAPLHAAFFKRWLGEGRQAGMAYMEGHEAKRLDPRLLVEGCRTVVCVAWLSFSLHENGQKIKPAAVIFTEMT